MVTVVTFGTFDILHIGHIRILQRASQLGDTLIVGVSSDKLNIQKKNRKSVFNQSERIELIMSLKYVDAVFIENSLEEKEKYLRKFKADILVMGDDWKGKFDYLTDNLDIKIIYLPRTNYNISTTNIIKEIKENTQK